ncbi:MAG: hypothetical protein A2288_01635 [Candidatus Moranbacteria bacterium RIFOXYA12_FULL_44_15]|nr:MAG: hypothetical protein A2288_01635 [Candidatus Moranbacteria bacterium RIFOXYA12_FULL_44_15]OGI34276.1 MAG: hypothetical protein A2259_04415 [Candidatus Moranbacteria bacterium RIFOXYA2_FULL_43_15]
MWILEYTQYQGLGQMMTFRHKIRGSREDIASASRSALDYIRDRRSSRNPLLDLCLFWEEIVAKAKSLDTMIDELTVLLLSSKQK